MKTDPSAHETANGSAHRSTHHRARDRTPGHGHDGAHDPAQRNSTRGAAPQAQCRVDSPLGPLTLATSTHGLRGAWFDGQRHHPGLIDAPEDAAHPLLQAAQRALAAYWRSPASPQALQACRELPLDLQGTPFQRAVWAALRAIPPGQTRRYGDIARAVDRPAAVRAVGAAIGRNPVSVLVPCHRVLGADGSLTGYAGGLWRKQWLLAHEAAPGDVGRGGRAGPDA